MQLVVRDNWRGEFTEAPTHQGCRFRLPLPGEAAPLSDPFHTPGDPKASPRFAVDALNSVVGKQMHAGLLRLEVERDSERTRL